MELPNNRGNLLTPTNTELITPVWFMFAQFKVMLHYISIFFWPFGLSFDYGWKIPSTIWACILPLILLIGIVGYGIKEFLKNNISIISFCIAWFFVIMLPRTTIIPSTEFVCDYKTYLASLAPLLLLGICFTYLATKVRLPNLHPQISNFVLPVILCTMLGFGSMNRNKIWFSLETLWEDVVTKTYPHVPARAYNNYAAGLVEAGKEDKAIEFYLKAIETDSTYAEPVVNLALHYQMKNDINTALRYYQHAMMLKESHPEMYNNLGLLHLNLKHYAQAIQSFETSLKLKPYYSKALFNLGRVYYEQNKLDQALVYYEKAMNGDQQTLNYCYTHGMVSYMAQHYDQAIKSLEKVEATHPNLNNTRFLLASCYYNTNQPQKALPYFEFIYMQNPTNPLCCYNYAQSLLQTGQFAKALPLFMQCKNVPQLPHAPLHFIKCLHKVGEKDQAKKEVANFIKQATNKTLKQMGLQLKKEIQV
jgi:Tfp pilus assembly protein PilF